MKREQAIAQLLDRIGGDLIISSLGKISKELYELRKKRKEPANDFLMMGSMGCALGLGLGVALNTKKQVYVLIGDGELLMKLGSLATFLRYRPKNLHIKVLNNNCHNSTGGQETSFKQVKNFVKKYCQVIDVEKGSRKDLGKPDISPEEITRRFYKKIHS